MGELRKPPYGLAFFGLAATTTVMVRPKKASPYITERKGRPLSSVTSLPEFGDVRLVTGPTIIGAVP